MCLYPRFIKNKRYMPTKKNGYNPPKIIDPRTQLVPIGCGKCIECLKQKAREWQVRLAEEEKRWQYKYCLTFTFSCEELEQLKNELNLKECNAVATKAVRRFLERWRKKHKKSVTHWFITELGHENTERIHLHGIIFSNNIYNQEYIQQIWKYGNIRLGQWFGMKTINYLIKYVHKIDTDHKNYVPQILCSKGLGSNFLERYFTIKQYQFKEDKTIEFYRLPNGTKVNLPIYYRNKLWTDAQRQRLWIHRLNKAVRYVMGIEIKDIDTEAGINKYYSILKTAQKTNRLLGYGDDSKKWKKKDYNITLRMLNKFKRIEEHAKKR